MVTTWRAQSHDGAAEESMVKERFCFPSAGLDPADYPAYLQGRAVTDIHWSPHSNEPLLLVTYRPA